MRPWRFIQWLFHDGGAGVRSNEGLKLQRGQKIAMTLVLGYPAVHYQRSVPRDEPEVTRL
ncbi:MAG: hypothetical protein ACLSA6_14655 [Holdemania massiliensis]